VTIADARPTLREPVLDLAGTPLDLSRHLAVMAIVNRTPDSFYDRGATFALDAAVAAGVAAVRAGAEGRRCRSARRSRG
jgi:dihydropteroate synthase